MQSPNQPAHPKRPTRVETFDVDDAASLVRSVIPARGEPYEHRCPPAAFEAVALAIDGFTGRFTLADIHTAAGVTWTQAAVAFAFLKERGVVTPIRGRHHIPASATAFEDAMVEYLALRYLQHGR